MTQSSVVKGKNVVEYKIPLHYIGNRTYGIERFVKEAKNIGVSRTLPTTLLKQMEWGQPVLLAVWRRMSEEQDRKTREKGSALVFGYFTITGLNASNQLVQIAKKHLNIKGSIEYDGGQLVRRGCGTYSVTATHYIDNTLKETVEALEKAMEELGMKEKIFATGQFHELEHFTITPAPFTRSITYVSPARIPREILEKIPKYGEQVKEYTGKKEINEIKDYRQVKNPSKLHIASLDSKTLDEYMYG